MGVDYCNLFVPQTSLDLVTKRSGGPHPEGDRDMAC